MSSPVNSINRLVPGIVENVSRPLGGPAEETATTNEGFASLLSEFASAVNDLHAQSGDAQKALLAGEPIELHQVMILGEQAGLATDLLLEIRNKLVAGFNEIMRMPM